MKAEIHPTAFEAKVTCASCGKTWVTLSTRKELRIDVCSNCHPFFTGESARLMDIEGQVDRFYKKLSARQTYVEQQKSKEEASNSPDRSIDDLELSPCHRCSQESRHSEHWPDAGEAWRRQRRRVGDRWFRPVFPHRRQEEIARFGL
ncbi:MAG: 50S ribosomal protein L31 [Anaerolineales bacterium]|nr:50S ribosomal protein L31 [Anaerolineales bacterium]